MGCKLPSVPRITEFPIRAVSLKKEEYFSKDTSTSFSRRERKMYVTHESAWAYRNLGGTADMTSSLLGTRFFYIIGKILFLGSAKVRHCPMIEK